MPCRLLGWVSKAIFDNSTNSNPDKAVPLSAVAPLIPLGLSISARGCTSFSTTSPIFVAFRSAYNSIYWSASFPIFDLPTRIQVKGISALGFLDVF
jgi:hypothetical protein